MDFPWSKKPNPAPRFLDENIQNFLDNFSKYKGQKVKVNYINLGGEIIHQGILLSASFYSICLGSENKRTHSLSFGSLDISNRLDYIEDIFSERNGKFNCIYHIGEGLKNKLIEEESLQKSGTKQE